MKKKNRFACQTKSVSSYHLARNLGITHKSAWYIKDKIMSLLDEVSILRGEIECDELHIDGIEGTSIQIRKPRVLGYTEAQIKRMLSYTTYKRA